jgi:hypothetical protein
MPIDLVQAGVAASLGDCSQAFDPLNIVEILGEYIGQKRIRELC